jgi:hypothetical protein
MAATATEQVIHNGARNLVLKYTIAGSTGDTTAGVLVDASALDAALVGNRLLRLDKAEWSLSGFSCKLLWDGADADIDLIQLAAGEGLQDFRDCYGIVNKAANASGDVLFTTTGYAGGGEGGHITLSFRKKNTIAASFTVAPAAASLTLTGEIPIRA